MIGLRTRDAYGKDLGYMERVPMKKILFFILAICFLFIGCSNVEGQTESGISSEKQEHVDALTEEIVVSETIEHQEASVTPEQAEPAVKVYPLSDTTMENLSDALLSISLEEGGAYVDDTGKMQMDVKLYTYDKYDICDISMLKVGDILVTHAGEVMLNSLERNADGSILVNGGLVEGGFDLVTDDSGCFYERGHNDAKNWYEIGKATIRVSVDFKFYDSSNLEQGEILFYPGSFLIGEVTNYDFTPYNTTIRVENSQIIEMHRVYIP